MPASSGSASPQTVPATQPTTAPVTTPAAPQEQGADGFVAQKAKKAPKFESALDRTLWELNQQHGGGDDPEFKSLAQITEEVQAAAPENRHGSPDVPERERRAVGGETAAASTQDAPAPHAPQKKRYQVGEKIYELSPEQQERTIQKGLYLESKNQALAQWERKLEGGLQQLQQQQQQFQAMMQEFAQNPTALYERMYGPERARQMFEPYVGQHVLREVEYEKNPQQRVFDQQQQQIQHLQSQLQQAINQLNGVQSASQTAQLTQHYQEMIVHALDATKNTWMKGDLGAADMAAWMQRYMEQYPKHQEQELADFMVKRAPGLMKEDWKRRTQATTLSLSTAINAARAKGDVAEVTRLGEELVDMLGKDVMYAIGKYHVTLLRSKQPQVPRSTQETTRSPDRQTEQRRRPDQLTAVETEDKRRRIIAAMDRGEPVPENVWEIDW